MGKNRVLLMIKFIPNNSVSVCSHLGCDTKSPNARLIVFLVLFSPFSALKKVFSVFTIWKSKC